MNRKEQTTLAARLLGLPEDDVRKHGRMVDEDGLFYVSVPEKGGPSLLVAGDGSVLYANSSVSFRRHLEAFHRGVRTPREAFEVGEV